MSIYKNIDIKEIEKAKKRIKEKILRTPLVKLNYPEKNFSYWNL